MNLAAAVANATNLEHARLDPAHTLHDISLALEKQASANQAVDDMHTTLRLRGWGKIQKIDWDGDWESDDQGGSDYYTHGFGITIDGERISLGSSVNEDWDGMAERVDEFVESGEAPDGAFEEAVAKHRLLGISDEQELFEHVLADLAGISYIEFQQFLWLAARLVEEDNEAGEIKFTA